MLDTIRKSALSVALAGLGFVAGCSVDPTIDARGPYSWKSNGYVDPGTRNPGQVGIFEASYATAYRDEFAISSGNPGSALSNIPGCNSTDGSCSLYSVHSRQMALDGVTLSDALCEQFFRQLGDTQRWIIFTRDIVSNIGTIAAGAAALATGAGAAAPASVGFSIATANTGLDVYSRNFLFGAENIESVRTLVQKARANHTTTALPEPDNSAWTFKRAQEVVEDHQAICRPAKILALTREAISAGSPQPVGTDGQVKSQADTNSGRPASSSLSMHVLPTP